MQNTMQTTTVQPWQRVLARWGGWIFFGLLAIIVIAWGYITSPSVTEAVLASTVRQATPLPRDSARRAGERRQPHRNRLGWPVVLICSSVRGN